jgi:antitoxin Phd
MPKAVGTPDNNTDPIWRLQDAKARFSELVQRAMEEGPQHTSVRGEPAVVALSEAEYRQLTAPRPSIVGQILSGEAWSDDLAEVINDRAGRTDREVEV